MKREMNQSDYFGENELANALALVSDHIALHPVMESAVPFEADASYRHADFGKVPSTVSISKCASQFHQNQCYQVSMTLQLPKVRVDKILTAGEADKIVAWLKLMQETGIARSVLSSTYRTLDDLEKPPVLTSPARS